MDMSIVLPSPLEDAAVPVAFGWLRPQMRRPPPSDTSIA
jgi:hypothetical protein